VFVSVPLVVDEILLQSLIIKVNRIPHLSCQDPRELVSPCALQVSRSGSLPILLHLHRLSLETLPESFDPGKGYMSVLQLVLEVELEVKYKKRVEVRSRITSSVDHRCLSSVSSTRITVLFFIPLILWRVVWLRLSVYASLSSSLIQLLPWRLIAVCHV
jgi:hypothetical protein